MRVVSKQISVGLAVIFGLLGTSVLFCNCNSSSSGGSPNTVSPGTQNPAINMTLSRVTSSSPNPINLTVNVTDQNGNPLAGQIVTVTVSGGASVSSVTDQHNGSYTAQVTPGFPSGEVPIDAQVMINGTNYTVQKTAVVLPGVNASWGQPEAVRGSVNTNGYQDGVQISPDGNWLIMTDYSPVDFFCCQNGCGTQTPGAWNSPYCQKVVGPYTAPSRPNFPGANRIVSATQITNSCPKACYTSDGTATGGPLTNIALPPIGGYIFKRQADGSFGQPTFIGLDADGCAVPEGYSFAAAPVGNSANIVFAWTTPFTSTYNIYSSPITLGSTNTLATLSCTTAYNISYSGVTGTQMNLNLGGNLRGNPTIQGGNFLWLDDDGAAVATNSLYYATVSGQLPNPTVSALGNVAAGTPSDGHKMSFFDPSTNTLYYTSRGGVVIASDALNGANPSVAGNWAAQTNVLTAETWTANPPTRSGSIGSLGQPSIASPAGAKQQLYFEYVFWNGQDMIFHVAMVPHL